MAEINTIEQAPAEVRTLEQVPAAVNRLLHQVEALQKLMAERINEPRPEVDRWMNLDEFCEYHPDKPKKPTAYGWGGLKAVPFHKDGKKLRFLKSEVDAWLLKGSKKPFTAYSADADAYIKAKGLNNGK